MKKLTHIFVAITCMALILSLSATAFATNSHTASDGVAWANARANEQWCVDVDGTYGCQCVDLILAYYQYLVGYRVSGNACDYRSNNLPSGWVRNSSATVGDVVVWGPGARLSDHQWADSNYGHIGIVVAINGSLLTTVETNAHSGVYAKVFTDRYASTPACFIHPDFAPEVGILDLNGLLDGEQIGGLSDYGTCDVYINGSLAADRTNTTDYVDSLPAGTTYSITNIKANEGFSYDGLAPGSAPLSGTIQSGVRTDVWLTFNSCKLDINGWLDNEECGTLLDYGTFDLYVNGVKIKDDIDDFWDRLPKGATYEIKDIKAAPGHVYNGPHSGSLKGTIVSGRTNVSLSFSTTGEISSDWITVDKLPGNINSTICDIQVKNHYSTTATTSPGSGWVNQGVAREEWVNSGEPYDVYNYPLETSASRECLSDIWFHFCGPNAEGAGNYEQTGNFVHWDAIDNSRVTGTKYLGNDNGNPYYFIYVDGSSTEFYCQSGITCDGSYGQHGARCRVWYRLYRYQDKVKVTYYNFTKDSNWTTTADSSATSVQYRYRLKSSLTKLALPANLTVIEDEAFAGAMMNAVIVPDGCTAIGSRAFANCSELVFVSVPKGTVIAADAFEGCGSVTVNER